MSKRNHLVCITPTSLQLEGQQFPKLRTDFRKKTNLKKAQCVKVMALLRMVCKFKYSDCDTHRCGGDEIQTKGLELLLDSFRSVGIPRPYNFRSTQACADITKPNLSINSKAFPNPSFSSILFPWGTR